MSALENPLVGVIHVTDLLINTYPINSGLEIPLATLYHSRLYFINYNNIPNQIYTFANMNFTDPTPQTIQYVGQVAGYIPSARRQVYPSTGGFFDEESFGDVTENLLGVYYADQPVVYNFLTNQFVPELMTTATVAMTRSFIPPNPSINGYLNENLQTKFVIQGVEYFVTPRPQDLQYFSIDPSIVSASAPTVHLNKYLVTGTNIMTLPYGFTVPNGAVVEPLSTIVQGTDSNQLCLIVDGVPFVLEDTLPYLPVGSYVLHWWSRNSPASLTKKYTTDWVFYPNKGNPGDFAFFADVHDEDVAYGSIFSEEQLAVNISFMKANVIGMSHTWSGDNSEDIRKKATRVEDGMTTILDPIVPGELFDNMNTGEYVTLTMTYPIIMTTPNPPGYTQISDTTIQVDSSFEALLVPQNIYVEGSVNPNPPYVNNETATSLIVAGVSIAVVVALVCLSVTRVKPRM